MSSSTTVEKPTTPPRVSFGVEIEFMVCRSYADEEGVNENLGLPQVTHRCVQQKEIAQLLLDHGIPVDLRTAQGWGLAPESWAEKLAALGATPANSWTVSTDLSVREYHTPDMAWEPVEIASPPSYAFDEAFEMVEMVVDLITTNFRTRTNGTCGIHVHVGNGPQRIDLRAARNYAALLWAVEPSMSTLFCPSRTIQKYSKSFRRAAQSRLAKGLTAEDARLFLADDPVWASRYQGRARKLGESPVPSRVRFMELLDQTVEGADNSVQPTRFPQPECPSDTEDWEDPSGRPFQRPRKKPPGERQPRWVLKDLHSQQIDYLSKPEKEHLRDPEIQRKLDESRIVGGPPLAHPDIRLDAQPNMARPAPETDDGLTLPSFNQPIIPRTLAVKPKQIPLADIYGNKDYFRVMDIEYDELYTEIQIREGTPTRGDTWSAIQELLSCDVSLPQVAYLMAAPASFASKGDDRHCSVNWLHCSKKSTNFLQGTGLNSYMTVENRCASASLDGRWVATWARINTKMLEFARDAEPTRFMRVLAKLAEEDDTPETKYDFVDFLQDLGAYECAVVVEDRLKRGDEALYECLIVHDTPENSEPGMSEENEPDVPGENEPDVPDENEPDRPDRNKLAMQSRRDALAGLLGAAFFASSMVEEESDSSGDSAAAAPAAAATAGGDGNDSEAEDMDVDVDWAPTAAPMSIRLPSFDFQEESDRESS